MSEQQIIARFNHKLKMAKIHGEESWQENQDLVEIMQIHDELVASIAVLISPMYYGIDTDTARLRAVELLEKLGRVIP